MTQGVVKLKKVFLGDTMYYFRCYSGTDTCYFYKKLGQTSKKGLCFDPDWRELTKDCGIGQFIFIEDKDENA